MSTPEFTALRLADGVLAPAGSELVLAEWTADGVGGGGEPLYQAPLHRHDEDEAWYVLEGTLRIRLGSQVTEITAGGAMIVPGGTAHTYWNPLPDPARYLLIMGPRTYALIQAIHASTDHDSAALQRLFHEHGAELLDI